MTISYSNYVEKLLVEARDIMRADNSLCVLLGTTTLLSQNFIFSCRPTDQKRGFTNPRIVCEAPLHKPQRVGDNPDGYHEDTVTFTINGWVNEQPIATPLNVMERIRALFSEKTFSTTEGGAGLFSVETAELTQDPDKLATTRCRVLINAKLKQQP